MSEITVELVGGSRDGQVVTLAHDVRYIEMPERIPNDITSPVMWRKRRYVIRRLFGQIVLIDGKAYADWEN